MTEYGRGQGPGPWHPEDPLYGDQGWVQGEDPYRGQQDQQQPYPQQQYDAWGNPVVYDQHGYPQGQQQAYGADPSGQGGGHDPGHGRQGYPGEAGPQYPSYQQPQQPQQYGGQQAPQQYGGQQQPPAPQQYGNGWDTGRPQTPYGGEQSGQYGAGQDGYGQGDPYGQDGQGDPYGQGYPATGPAHGYQEPQPPAAPAEPADGDWDPERGEPEHPFFASDGDAGRARGGRERERDDENDEDGGGAADRHGRRGGGKPKKRRSGCACLVVAVVLVGGGGGAAYYGYHLYQDRFGPAPDYAGEGSGTVVVEIPDGATGIVMGNRLKEKGVVKSVDAFTEAQGSVPQGKTVQPGFYTLRKGMSAKSAVDLMLSPKSRNTLIVPEGYRNSWVYAQIDDRLGLAKGTTARTAKDDWKSLGLPKWANSDKDIKDPLEGFLFPSAYSVSKGQKPQDVLKRMVAQADKQYERLDIVGQSKKLDLKSPLQLVTVASLVNAEGLNHSDFEKMAEVVYNRLKPGNTETNGMLEFDSTYNYAMNQSKLDMTQAQLRKTDHPYNTYFYKGLPPGPIGNPGADALSGAMKPSKDGWYYFAAIGDKTTFTKTYKEHEKIADEVGKLQNQ
ncbi:endolytic transglycosylase MltG [Streptomyces sp. NPDC007088]|uniref:endolytic transglycosylase MltG n=1 Tax=Streptomyces sp. NPDC007088 TaxID=3364773 RepID=UPI0036C13F66